MNILLLNPTHPATPHISGVRAWRFAQELARLGHRAVLLTGDPPDGAAPTGPWASHDWSGPWIACCGPLVPDGPGAGPAIVRRAATAARVLRHGGRNGAWAEAAVRAAFRLRPSFDPDVIWCTVGRLEAAIATRRIATRMRRPWVLDVKDYWESVVPAGLRRLVSWRLRGCAAVTANARLTADLATRWLAMDATVIYSGVDDEFLRPAEAGIEPPAEFAVNLVGGTYFPDRLAQWCEGVGRWVDRLTPEQRQHLAFTYIGAEVDQVAGAVAARLPGLRWRYPGYVPMAEMAWLCRGAAVNAYIAHPATFHHKLLELLACGRPVMAFPEERLESRELAAALDAPFDVPNTPEAVAECLARAQAAWTARPAAARAGAGRAGLSWPERTRILEQVLIRAAHSRS